jgi:hypothetical protein
MPERFAAYYTRHGGDSTTLRPMYYACPPRDLWGKVTALTTAQALAANAEGRFEYRVTHSARVAFHSDLRVGLVLRRKRDGVCFYVLSVRESNTRLPNGNPDHLSLELCILDPPPELPGQDDADRWEEGPPRA